MRYVDKEQGVKNQEENNEIQQEQKSQLNYLVNCVKQLRQRLDKERLAHKMDNQEVMERNSQLIKEIGDLRTQIEELQQQFNDVGGIRTLTEIMKRREERDKMLEQIEQQDAQASQGSKANIGGSMQEGMDGFDPEIQREIQQRRQLLEKLKEQITLKRNEREQTKMI